MHPFAPAPQQQIVTHPQSETNEEELRQACYQYYLAQQALQNAEDDNLQMQTVMQNLRGQLQRRSQDVLHLRETKHDLERQAEAMRYLPKDTTPETGRRYIAAERTLHTRIALADDAIDCVRRETAKVAAEMEREAATTNVLEQSLDAQVRYNKVLTAAMKEAVAKAKHEEQRISNLRARRAVLDAAIQKERLEEKRLGSSVATAAEMRSRAQDELRSRDSEAVRLRADVAFGRRLHLGEMEHAREQELWLEELLLENRKLKILAANSRRGLPDLGRRAGATGDPFGEVGGISPVTAAKAEEVEGPSAAADESVAVVAGSDGVAKRVAIDTVGDASLLDLPRQDAGGKGTGAPSQQKRLVDDFREYNLALLQQMVNSLHILQTQIAPSNGATARQEATTFGGAPN